MGVLLARGGTPRSPPILMACVLYQATACKPADRPMRSLFWDEGVYMTSDPKSSWHMRVATSSDPKERVAPHSSNSISLEILNLSLETELGGPSTPYTYTCRVPLDQFLIVIPHQSTEPRAYGCSGVLWVGGSEN